MRHAGIASLAARLLSLCLCMLATLAAHAQIGANTPTMRYVFATASGGTSYSFSQYPSFTSLGQGAALAQDVGTWHASMRAMASDGDEWYSITRNGGSNCFSRHTSYAQLLADRSEKTICNTVAGDGFRGLAYDGHLFYTIYWDGSRHWWQSYKSWENVAANVFYGQQTDNRNGDIYKGIGFDPIQHAFFSLAQSGSTVYWYKYATFSDMVAVRNTADSHIFGSASSYAGVAVGPTDPTLDVYIVAGQSNAVGWDADATWLTPSADDANIGFFYRIGNGMDGQPTTSGNVTTLQPQAPGWRSPTPLAFGIEMGLGRSLYDSGRRNMAIVKVAYGGTYLATQWNPVALPNLSNTLQANLANASAQWNALGYRTRIVGFFWMQGEFDALDPNLANAYYGNLKQYIASVRAWSGDPCMPFIFGRITVDPWPYSAAVRAAQAQIASEDSCTRMVDTDDLPKQPGDSNHYSTPSEFTLGQRMGNAFSNLAGW